MPRDFTSELVACLGDPVRENPTGVMQNAAFEALGLQWQYLTIEVTPAHLGDAVAGIRAFGLRGANFTIPHKVAVMEYLDRVAPDAALIGARGESMVNELAGRTGVPIRFETWPAGYRIPPEADLLVNATSIGLYPDVRAMPPVDWSDASDRMLVCDVVPNPPETRFLQEARHRGLPVLDGLSMLVHQGAIGFQMWTGLDAPVDVMRAALNAAFAPG